MKASGASEKLQGEAKAAPAKTIAEKAPRSAAVKVASAPARAEPSKPAATKPAATKPGGEQPAALPPTPSNAVAGKPVKAAPAANPIKAAPVGATPSATKPAPGKPAAADVVKPPVAAIGKKPVTVAAEQKPNATPPPAPPSPVPSAPAAAADMPAKAPRKPEIETSHIVTIPATDSATLNPPMAPVAEPPAVAKPVEAKPSEPVPRAPAPMINGRPAPISRASNKDESFSEGDFVVYPTHGVGKVEKIAKEEIAGHHLELIHITFEENRMTLRVPVSKARSAGLRRLSTRKAFDEALAVLKGRARIKRTMWSRRAQEYEAKINSGDPMSIAEVVRDLHRNAGQPDQSFSERQIYEAAMDRLAAELGALDLTDKNTALIKLGNFLKTL